MWNKRKLGRGRVLLMVKLMCVNINGLGREVKRRWLKALVMEKKCNFLCIQETHLQSVDPWVVKSCWGNNSIDYASVGSMGRSGGLLTL